MSLYEKYLTEKTDVKIIETPNGFVTYVFNDQGCWIKDIYVEPDFRGSGYATDLANLVATQARDAGKSKLFGSVIPSNKDSTTSLKVLLGYGMKLDSSTNDFILFSKEL